MNYVQLGNTSEQVSEMCLGTMMFGERCDEAEADRILGTAVEQGVNFIDTAAMYCDGKTEEIIGRIIKGRREELFIATKVHKGIDIASITESIDESLARLRIDYVDLYLIHWPKPGMCPQEVMEALNSVVNQGKARYVGCCNYPAWLFAHSNATAKANNWAPLNCNQIPYNLIERGAEVEILPQALTEQIAITVYRPLSIGLLAGKYTIGKPLPLDSRGNTDRRVGAWLNKYGDAIERFNQFAADRRLHPAQLVLSWVRYSPAITAPIVGVSSVRQLETSIHAFDYELSHDEYAEVSGIFDTTVKEESGGSYPDLRRALNLVECRHRELV